MNIEWLKNKAKEKFYPITHAKAVLFGENNRTVNDEIDQLKNDLSQLSYNENSINGNIVNGTNLIGTAVREGSYALADSVVVPSGSNTISTVYFTDGTKSTLNFSFSDGSVALPNPTTSDFTVSHIYFNSIHVGKIIKNIQLEIGTTSKGELYYVSSNNKLTKEIHKLKNDLSNLKDGTTPAAKAVADEDGNNIKSTYAKKTEAFETLTEDVNVVLNSDLFDLNYNSNITCIRIGKLCVLSFTIYAPNAISSTIDKIVLMSIVGTKYRPKKPGVSIPRQTFQGFAVGNYDENGTQSQSLNNTVRIITDAHDNYTEIITIDKDRINWNGYVQGQIMWVTD